MSSETSLVQQIESECDLPESWGAHKVGPLGNIEVSGYDGEELQETTIELINDDNIVEVVLSHAAMPGRASANKMDELDSPISEVPSPVGVLQFGDLDDAVDAVDHLADPDVLAKIAELRSKLETEDPRSVRDAVAEATDIDMSTVNGTLTSI